MHAFLVSSDIHDFITKFEGKKLEFKLAKIADVRELSQFTRLKVNEKTVIILRDFERASEETQNAFLKALEEPQENLSYILTTNNADKILPTIISRCEVVEFPSSKLQITNDIKEQITNFINAEAGERLKIISVISKREDAIEFMQNLIKVTHEMFIKEPELASLLQAANETLRNLEANGNVTLQLLYFVSNVSV